jgi:hypothetical protein
VVSDYWVYHCEYCRLIVLRIVLFPKAVFRSEVEFSIGSCSVPVVLR